MKPNSGINFCTLHYSSFQEYRNGKELKYLSDKPLVTHCTYCFPTLEMYVKKFKSFAHTEFDCYPYTNESYIFKRHYCRMMFHTARSLKQEDISSKLKEWVPNDKRFNFLIDPNYRLDITKTIYRESDLPTMCNNLYSFP